MKKVLVTGGSRGIGRELVTHLVHRGYRVAFTFQKEKERAEDLVHSLRERGGDCQAYCCDVGDYTQTQEVFGKILQELQGLDGFVANAGVAHWGLLQDMTLEQWQNVMNVNLNSLFYGTKAVIPAFVAQNRGHIITVSSMWGQVGASCEVAYSASKAGVIGFTKALAQELAPSHILVNCVAPGVIETDMIKNLTEEDKICLKEEIPLGRLGTGEEVAKVVGFLLEFGDYFTGQVLAPNGGLVM